MLDAAHDSSCACSVDEVVDAVLVRYARGHRQSPRASTGRALDALAADSSAEGALVVNPSATTRSGLVELRLPGTSRYAGTQQLSVDERRGRRLDGLTRRGPARMLVQAALDNLPHLQRGEAEVDEDGTL